MSKNRKRKNLSEARKQRDRRNETDKPSDPPQPPLLTGEVWNHFGRIAGSVPPIGMPGAIPFTVRGIIEAADGAPSWAVVEVAGRTMRINPVVVAPPFFRLFDFVTLCANHWKEVPARCFRVIPVGGKSWAVGRLIGPTGETLFVDTEGRFREWGATRLPSK